MRKGINKEEKQQVQEAIESIQNREYSDADVEKVLKNEKKIKSMFLKEALKKYAEYVSTMFSMIKDFVAKRYKEIPIKYIITMVGTLLYVLSPIDIIPDPTPVVGLMDDAAVVAGCIKLVATYLEKYLTWKKNQANL